MYLNVEVTSLLLILANFLVSLQGFNQMEFRQRYHFRVDRVIGGREYHRLFTSGFLHSGWSHLIFNMLALYLFAPALDALGVSVGAFLLLYISALVGGNLVALGLHRNHGDYSALGASGAVNGVIFAAIALMPSLKVWFMPGWLFGIMYLLATIYGIKAQYGRVSHESHLGGALVGIFVATALNPSILFAHPLVIMAMVLPAAGFLFLVYTRPESMMIPNYLQYEMSRVKETIGRSPSTRLQTQKDAFTSPEEEIDHLLDKGIENLTKKEKKRLEELSRSLNG